MALRSPRCLFNSATALHRIFVAPIEQSPVLLAHRLPPRSTTLLPSSLLQTRRYASPPQPKEGRLPHDDLIKAWSIRLVNEDGTLGDIRSTREVLESLNRDVETLIQVAPEQEGAPPVCKIMNRRELREAEKARAKAARRGAGPATKTLELNWAIDKGDLGHRLDKLKGFLAKGLKVEIALASKRRGRQATEEEAQALLRRIRDTVKEVQGGKEVKPMEGKLLRSATLYLGKVES